MAQMGGQPVAQGTPGPITTGPGPQSMEAQGTATAQAPAVPMASQVQGAPAYQAPTEQPSYVDFEDDWGELDTAEKALEWTGMVYFLIAMIVSYLGVIVIMDFFVAGIMLWAGYATGDIEPLKPPNEAARQTNKAMALTIIGMVLLIVSMVVLLVITDGEGAPGLVLHVIFLFIFGYGLLQQVRTKGYINRKRARMAAVPQQGYY